MLESSKKSKQFTKLVQVSDTTCITCENIYTWQKYNFLSCKNKNSLYIYCHFIFNRVFFFCFLDLTI